MHIEELSMLNEINEKILDEEEIKIVDGLQYKEASLPDSMGNSIHKVGTNVTSGKEFDKEKSKLNSVIKNINNKIRSIQNESTYTGKYAVVRGGGDVGEYAGLNFSKNSNASNYETISKLSGVIKSPYKYRVDQRLAGKEKPTYLGPVAFSGDSESVVSYFSPEGKRLATYNAADTEINKQIVLRREFLIDKSVLKNFKNIQGTKDENDSEYSVDAFLIDVLKMRRNDRIVSDIILTIQKNQNKIVEAIYNKNIIVQGCAGSGKTMVMMHRLSRLQNWVHAFNMRDVVILTPNDQYKMYMHAVTEGLAISQITQNTVEEYYNSLISEYDSHLAIKNQIRSEIGIDDRFLKYIYSTRFLGDLDRNYEAVLNNRKNLEPRFRKILQKYGKSAFSVSNFKEYDYPDVYGRYWAEISKEVEERKNKYSSLLFRLEILNNRLLEVSSEEYYKNAKDNYEKVVEEQRTVVLGILKNIITDAEDYYIRDIISDGEESKSTKEAWLFILQASRLDPSIENSVKVCEEANSALKGIEKEKNDIIKTTEKLTEEIKVAKGMLPSEEDKKELEYLKSAAELSSHANVFNSIFEKTINPVLDEYGMKRPMGYHRYDLYARLLFARRYFMKNPLIHRYIFVDEGQDISPLEYNLLYELSDRKSVFNIFGDVNQALFAGHSTTDWNIIDKIFKTEHYYLEENYRNSNQITRHCNERFGMSMKEIGIDGKPVRAITELEMLNEIVKKNMSEGTRIAILVPRTYSKKNYSKKLNSSKITTQNIHPSEIALMYVDEVKGFEFDEVYVVDEKMTFNEKYVAYSRALSNLCIVR